VAWWAQTTCVLHIQQQAAGRVAPTQGFMVGQASGTSMPVAERRTAAQAVPRASVLLSARTLAALAQAQEPLGSRRSPPPADTHEVRNDCSPLQECTL
jgi:hypothetical protein